MSASLMTTGDESVRRRERIIFNENQIALRVKQVAAEIALRPARPEIAMPILVGAFVFAADLLRELARHELQLETEFIWLRSYGASNTPGALEVLKRPGESVRGRNVLLIDGVLDRGATLARARSLLQEAGASGIISAVAVIKAAPQPLFHADYALFTAGAEFLYGYGMDRAGRDRGLPDIRVIDD
jgi:hypoxanthine phosphoribosyltransferase